MATKKTTKILIVEDESMLREALSENLTEEGYEVEGSPSAKEAIELMTEFKPDAILTDLVMPEIDGYEFLGIINERIDLHGIPVIVLSNMGEKEDIEKAKSLGAKDFIIKSDTSLANVTKRVIKVVGKP